MDRALFGGTPEDVPELYRERSPLTYVDAVDTPLLIVAGENDSRCPIRQIDNFAKALEQRGGDLELYRYETGHSSYVTDERVRQMRTILEFLARHVDTAEMSA
jgi:dipeptidyl aminopeptidase/acylaminoacyl peptidase